MSDSLESRIPIKIRSKVQMTITVITVTTAILLLIGTIWINYINLNEAFGSGSPYYGQTANMDKWSNPIPILLFLDIVVIIIVASLVKLGVYYFKLARVAQNQR